MTTAGEGFVAVEVGAGVVVREGRRELELELSPPRRSLTVALEFKKSQSPTAALSIDSTRSYNDTRTTVGFHVDRACETCTFATKLLPLRLGIEVVLVGGSRSWMVEARTDSDP